jgi:hypothetical protein
MSIKPWAKFRDAHRTDPKKTLPVVQRTGSEYAVSVELNLFYGDGALFTNFDTALATQTLFAVDDCGFTILHLEHFDRTDINALLAARAFVFIHNRIKSHWIISFQKFFSVKLTASTLIGFTEKTPYPNW